MGTTYRDLRYGVRTLLAKPGFTLAAATVLALGIGANTAIFSLVNAFLLKPLVLEKPGAVGGLLQPRHPQAGFLSRLLLSQLRRSPGAEHGLHQPAGAQSRAGGTDGRRPDAPRIRRHRFVELLRDPGRQAFPGPRVHRRRGTSRERDSGGHRQPLFWQKKGSDPQLLGKTLKINGRIFTVIGIAPEGFTGTTALVKSGLLYPARHVRSGDERFRGSRPVARRA